MNTKLVLLALITTALLGCKTEFKGGLEVNNSVVLDTVKGGKLRFVPGYHPIKAKIVKSNAVELQYTGSGLNEKMIFNTGFNMADLPMGQTVFIPATTNGQPYDLQAKTSQTSETMPIIRENESCTYYRNEQVCEWHPRPGGGSEQRCYIRQMPVQGMMPVEYNIVFTTQNLSVALYDVNTNSLAGNLSVDSKSSSKQYSFRGLCR